MTPVQRERCERAIAFGRHFVLPKGAEFDMSIWGKHPDDGHAPDEQNHCGTSACFAGWLSLDPWFREQGMAGEWRASCITAGWKLAPFGLHFGNGAGPVKSLEDFFGLSTNQVLHVFGADRSGTAADAANRLQACLDGAVT